MSARTTRIMVQDLVGARVRARDGRVVGHVEEMRAERRDGTIVVMAFLLGAGALRERRSLVRRVWPRARTIVVRWDQIDLSNPQRLALRCEASALEVEEPE